jgi:pilus assembly protein Flp/PilA
MINEMSNLIVTEEGQGMTEYGLLLGVIAVSVVTILVTMRESIIGVFLKRNAALDSAVKP